MFSFQDLTQQDVNFIFQGLMELPAKFSNPILQKLDAQFNGQVMAAQMKAKQDEDLKKQEAAPDQGAGTDLTDTPTE